MDSHTHVLELKADKLRERPNENALIQARIKPVTIYRRHSRWWDDDPELPPPTPVVNSYGAVQTTLVVKPTLSSIHDGKQVQNMIECQLDSGKPFVTYSELRSLLSKMSESQLEAALSLVLTFPGRWGAIKAQRPGEFRRFNDSDYVDPLTEPDDWE